MTDSFDVDGFFREFESLALNLKSLTSDLNAARACISPDRILHARVPAYIICIWGIQTYTCNPNIPAKMLNSPKLDEKHMPTTARTGGNDVYNYATAKEEFSL